MMANVFLSSEQQGIVVFWIWKSLSYSIRMIISFACILAGFVIQYHWYSLQYHRSWYALQYHWYLALGVLLILLGNLFLLVRGYDNRINFGKYTPESGWEKVEQSKLLEVEQFVKKMKKWE